MRPNLIPNYLLIRYRIKFQILNFSGELERNVCGVSERYVQMLLAAFVIPDLPADGIITASKVCICNAQVSARSLCFTLLRLEVRSHGAVVANEQAFPVKQNTTFALKALLDR